MTKNNPDLIFKELFKVKAAVTDLLVHIIGKDWANYIDYDTLELQPTELIHKRFKKRITDLVYKVKIKDELFYIIIIIEFQAAIDHFMALRINTYTSLLLEQLVKIDKIKPGEKLPLMLPIVFYNGVKRWTAPITLKEHFHDVPDKFQDFKKYIPNIEYLLIDLSQLDATELLKNDKSFISLMAAIETTKDIDKNYEIYAKVVQLIQNSEHILSILRDWFRMILSYKGREVSLDELKNEESFMIKHKPVNVVEEYKQAGRQEGRQEGEKLGFERGKHETFLKLINIKFGKINHQIEDKIKAASNDDLDKWLEGLMTASRIEDLFK